MKAITLSRATKIAKFAGNFLINIVQHVKPAQCIGSKTSATPKIVTKKMFKIFQKVGKVYVQVAVIARPTGQIMRAVIA